MVVGSNNTHSVNNESDLLVMFLQILKDITLRQKLLQGYKVHYVPGWDCHGLPIELKATQQTGKE